MLARVEIGPSVHDYFGVIRWQRTVVETVPVGRGSARIGVGHPTLRKLDGKTFI